MATLTTGGLVKTSFTVHPVQLARMTRIAKERGTTKSLILREALEKELGRLERGEPVLASEQVA